MFYIHHTACISPQQNFLHLAVDDLNAPVDNKLFVKEAAYEGISATMLRRMGKAVRICVGAALPLLKQAHGPDGIIIGTGNGGMEESMKFLNQIVDYNEDILTPGNFVQSTSNAAAAQIALLTRNKGYNTTHIHKGLAFENAVIDAAMMIEENKLNTYLLGGVDEISGCNHKFDDLQGWNKKQTISNRNLYDGDSTGTIAGEGAAMFLVSAKKENAIAQVTAVYTLHGEDENEVANKLRYFLDTHLPVGENVDLLLSGENGDNGLLHFYTSCELVAGESATVARFKHLCGEYPTASAFALWLACNILQTSSLPGHMIKKQSSKTGYKNVLIYNNHKGVQHSFMLVCRQG